MFGSLERAVFSVFSLKSFLVTTIITFDDSRLCKDVDFLELFDVLSNISVLFFIDDWVSPLEERRHLLHTEKPRSILELINDLKVTLERSEPAHQTMLDYTTVDAVAWNRD